MLRIRAERLARGWSQTVLAYRAGLSAPDISRIENGRQVPYPGQARALAKALRIPVIALLEEVGLGKDPKSSWEAQ